MPATAPDASPPTLALQLHGAPTCHAAAAGPAPLERKHAALLAYLWCEGPTPRARLAGLLWPEADETRARANLRQRLLKLRQTHGPLVHDDGPLLTLAGSVQVLPPAPPEAPLLGTLAFDDCDDLARWLDARRDAARAGHKRAWLARVRDAAQAGDLDAALGAAESLLQVDRESEEAFRVLMEVYSLRGDHAAALAAWDRCRDMLRSLYGVSPSPATQQLGQSLLAAARSAQAEKLPATMLAGRPAVGLPATVLRPPRLIGRTALQQAMAEAWHAGRVVCVCGSAGLGKTRLLADTLAVLPDPVAGPPGLVRVAARPGDDVLPYASLSRLLLALQAREPALFGGPEASDTGDAHQAARLLPQLAAALSLSPTPVRTDYERTQAMLAVARLLARAAGAGVHTFALDDLHFADAASLDALRVLAAAGPEGDPASRARPRWVLACRPDEGGEALAAVLRDLGAAPLGQRLDLAPLDADDTAALLVSLDPGGLPALTALQPQAEALWRHAGGNPAFLLETVKLLLTDAPESGGADALPLPDSQRAVIERRVALLSPPARHLAQLAAVAGGAYSVELAAEALACAPLALTEPLRELELRQVFYGRHFVHDVVASVVLDTVPAGMATFMHRLVAEHLVRRHGDHPSQVATIATHWAAAGEPLPAARAFRLAADAARDAALPAQQAALLDRAIALLEPLAGTPEGQRALFDALAVRATVYELGGFATQRLAVVARLEALAADERQRLQALNLRAGAQVDVAQAPDVAAVRTAVDRARALGDEALAWQFSRTLAWHWAMNDRAADAMALLDGCLPWMRGAAPPADRVSFRLTRSSVHAFSDALAEAIAEGGLAIDEALAINDLVDALPALSNVGLFHYWRGEYPQARARLELGRTLRDRHVGRAGAGIKIDVHLGAVLAELGETAAAQALLDDARSVIEAWPDGEQRRTECLLVDNHLAQMLLAAGRLDEAAEVLAREDSGVADRFRGRRLALRLRWCRLQGRTDVALIRELKAVAEAVASPFNRMLMALELARQAPPDRALAEARALADLPAAMQRPGLRLHALAVAAAAARSAGQDTLAVALARQARDLAGHCAPFDLGAADFAALLAQAEGGAASER
ncbi:BTAD domain-containing putative transcriptional regulator [Rubrivivax albus]|nr:BTAD domain-containing putative transcriptional regulator [Rubrivivax albus]